MDDINYEIVSVGPADQHLPPKHHIKRDRIQKEHKELIDRFNDMNSGEVMIVQSKNRATLEKLRTDLRSAKDYNLLTGDFRTYLQTDQDEHVFVLGINKMAMPKVDNHKSGGDRATAHPKL